MENEGVDYDYNRAYDAGALQKASAEYEAPLTDADRRFVNITWKAQELFSDGRFNVRGIWPHICLDTEFIYKNDTDASTKLASIAKRFKLVLEDMDAPYADQRQVSLTHRFDVKGCGDYTSYQDLLSKIKTRKAFIKKHTQKLWDLYGVSVPFSPTWRSLKGGFETHEQ